jgi:hypothetical protein
MNLWTHLDTSAPQQSFPCSTPRYEAETFQILRLYQSVSKQTSGSSDKSRGILSTLLHAHPSMTRLIWRVPILGKRSIRNVRMECNTNIVYKVVVPCRGAVARQSVRLV